MNRIILGIAVALGLAGPSHAAEKREIVLETRQFSLSPEVVVDPKDGSVRLARSTLIADEMGATDQRQTVNLSDRIKASKFFYLDLKKISNAELFIFGNPKQIEVNKKPVRPERLVSTGWTRAKVPPDARSDTGITVEMSGGGQLLFEPTRVPGRSKVSIDGRESWTLDARPGGQSGELLVRLRGIPAIYREGWALSPVFDLWPREAGGLGIPGKTRALRVLAKQAGGPPNVHPPQLFLRMGTTPAVDDRTWTDWESISEGEEYGEHISRRMSGESHWKVSRHRWAQLKFEFQGEPLPAPAQLTFSLDFERDPRREHDKLEVARPPMERSIDWTSVPFVYQAPSPRLKLLRERHKLDEVIAPGKTEMEQLVLLRHWVRNQWHTAWQGGAASWMPPWDAHIILDCKDQSHCLTMCTHYAAVFTQCCLALGWTARHCILDHHCVSEVFVNQHNKWVMMDAGNSKERADVGLHFERGGVPLSALELHLAYHQKKTDGITVHFTPKALAEKLAQLCRPEPVKPARPGKKAGKPLATGPRPDAVPLAELTQYPVCQIENYRRYAFPARNNYLDSLLPGELYQGWSAYFYDGYWWVGDSPDDPKLSPEYSKHLDPARPQDIDWSLNWTRIHLARATQAGELQVDLETLTPNFARFEVLADGKWKPTPARFTWPVAPGKNELRVRSVNQFERPGIEASVQVQRGE